MTIETIKGIVGVKIGRFDLLRLFLKYDPTGDIIKEARKTYGDKTLEEFIEISSDEAESDEWSDTVSDMGSNLSGKWNYCRQWVPQTLQIKHTEQDYRFKLSVYQLTHDRDEKCDFILGEAIMSINTDNTHFGSLARADDEIEDGENKRLEQIQTMMISFMKSTVNHDKMMERKGEMDENFPELKEMKMDYYLAQNDCDCCS